MKLRSCSFPSVGVDQPKQRLDGGEVDRPHLERRVHLERGGVHRQMVHASPLELRSLGSVERNPLGRPKAEEAEALVEQLVWDLAL